MQTMIHIGKSLFILLILPLINPSWLPAETAQRTALVIGNSSNSSGPLKKPVNYASDIAAIQPTTEETSRDGRFIAYSNGTVLDTNTNLMWAAKDNGSSISWSNARRYCENYRGGGYTDWRMPTQDELAGLYDKSIGYTPVCAVSGGNTDKVKLTNLITLSCWGVWASETRGSDAALFFFSDGLLYWLHRSLGDFLSRALPVRSGK